MIKGSFKKLFLAFLLLFLFSTSLSAQPASVLPDFIKGMIEDDVSKLKPIDFDWKTTEWIIHDEENAAKAEALRVEQEIENERVNAQAPVRMMAVSAFSAADAVVDPPSMTWNPARPFGGANGTTGNQFLPAMRKGTERNMPQDAWDRFKTPSFWYGAVGSGYNPSYIDAGGNYVKGTHDPLTDEPGSNVYGYFTSNLEIEMWFKELSERADLQGTNKRMQYKLVSGVPHYTGSATNYALTRTFNMVVAVFSKPSVFTPEEVKALGKPTVLLHASIHGNENCPSEAMLQVAKELAEGKFDDVLDKITVVMVPRYNPTGAWQNNRGSYSVAPIGHGGQSAGGFDMNRDSLGFESMEVRVVRYVANQYNPIAGIDGHEQGGAFEGNEQFRTASGSYSSNGHYRSIDAGISISTSNNININRDVRALGRYLYEPAMKKWLDDVGIGGNWYRSGTTAPVVMPTSTTGYLELDVVSSDSVS